MRSKIKILLIDDEIEIRRAAEKLLTSEGYTVVTASNAKDGLEKLASTNPDLLITDLKLPDLNGLEILKRAKNICPQVEVILITGYGSVETAVEAIQHGAYDFIEKPLDDMELTRVVKKALEKQSLASENRILREELNQFKDAKTLIGNSVAMAAIKEQIRQVAQTDVTVLIQGESGTGKEVVADLIHHQSVRNKNPMIKVSCAAIPETLLESELFGYERGAFTGASGTKPGKFELAEGGTLFLDEIGEMSPPLQAKLLRVLQDGRCQRLGGTHDIQTNVRVISATHVNLPQAILEKRFRPDLFFRLNVVQISLPPLRTRQEDIPLLAAHLLQKYASRMGKQVNSISPVALHQLLCFSWPGNVRELENAIQRALTECCTDCIQNFHLESAVPKTPTVPAEAGHSLQIPLGMTLDEIKTHVFAAVLQHCNGDKEKAAHMLGITSRTLYHYMPKIQIASAAASN